MNINVIMIAHNQMELVQQGLEVLRVFAGIGKDQVVLVDNASEDGLREWLSEQDGYNYIICDDGLEGYAAILNTVIREFQITEDILVLSPNYIALPDSIQEMQRVLHSGEKIGAVSATMIPCGSEIGKDYLTAVDFVKRRQGESRPDLEKLGLEPGAVMIKNTMREETGEFDDRLILPHSSMLDFLFRGILKNYRLLECGEAFLYETGASGIEYLQQFGKDIDRPVLKEKWDMNYFNNRPNENLIPCIQKEPDETFHVLEIGCDCGVNLLAVKNRYPNVKLYGAELNAHATEIASHIAEVEVGNIEDKALQFGDVRFDYIMFGDVLEHLRDPAGTIRYCRSLLKENGKIIACIPNLMHYTVMRELIDGNFTYKDMGLLDRTHIHFFTYYEIKRMFEEEGYEVEKIDSAVSSFTVTPEEAEFVANLVALSHGAEAFMFYTFQYIVTAKMKKENTPDAE